MDLSLSETQADVQGLARQVLEGELSNDRLKEVEADPDNFDRDLWVKFATAGLLGIGLPETSGGGGQGFIEVCLVLEEIGRRVAPLPYYPSIVLGALPIARFGSAAQKTALLPGVISGELMLSAALLEAESDRLRRPTTSATQAGDYWRLDGTNECVAAGMLADKILVPAATTDGKVIIAIVDCAQIGVVRQRQETTNGHAEARLLLSNVAVENADVIGCPDEGAAILTWMIERATAALCATASGLCQETLRMTAEYAKTREQFERPIATFQAVGQRAADGYIDTEAIRLTAWQAIWRLAEELPAAAEVATAKFWAAEAGQRLVHTAQHLHGGMGVDLDYPLHRYFLWAKVLELTLGGATPQLLRLGRILADERVPV